jgi:hypothetical protein
LFAHPRLDRPSAGLLSEERPNCGTWKHCGRAAGGVCSLLNRSRKSSGDDMLIGQQSGKLGRRPAVWAMAASVVLPARWISAITARVVALALVACSDLAARARAAVSTLPAVHWSGRDATFTAWRPARSERKCHWKANYGPDGQGYRYPLWDAKKPCCKAKPDDKRKHVLASARPKEWISEKNHRITSHASLALKAGFLDACPSPAPRYGR